MRARKSIHCVHVVAHCSVAVSRPYFPTIRKGLLPTMSNATQMSKKMKKQFWPG